MKLLRLSALLAAAAGLVLATGCSSSEFGSAKGDGPSAGAQKSAKEGDKTDEQKDSDKEDQKDSDADTESDNDTESKLDEKDESDAQSYEADDTTKGCALPADVQAKFESSGGAVGATLADWGGSGSANVELTNLSLTDCSWFKSFKDNKGTYIVQYDEKAEGAGLTGATVQSYAVPWGGANTPTGFGECLTAAAQSGTVCNKVGDFKF